MNPRYRDTVTRLALRIIDGVGGFFSGITGLRSRLSRNRLTRSTLPAPDGEHQRLLRRFVLASRLTGGLSVCVGLAVILGGWFFNFAMFQSILPGAHAMKANTALGVILVGAALGLNESTMFRASHRISLVLAAMAALIGTLTCLEYAIGRNLFIDQLFFRDSNRDFAVNPPGRMAFTAAVSLILLACAFLFSKRGRGASAAQVFAGAVAAMSFVSLVGYLYGVHFGIRNYHGIALYVSAAFPSSLTFFLLSLGVIFSTANEGWMATLSSTHLGGMMARRLFPVAIILPIGVGWLRWQGQLRGYFTEADGLAIAATVRVGVLLVLIWYQSRLLNRLDRERSESHESLKESESNFRQLADSMPQMVFTMRIDGWLDYCNQRWIDYTGLSAVQTQGWGRMAAIHPDDVEKVMEAWRRAVANGIAFEIEYRLRRVSDNTYRWHLGRGVALRDHSGRITKWFGTSTDIDDYKRTQWQLEEARQELELRVQERTAELERSNTLLNAILDSIGDGVICVNDQYEHILFNHAARQLLGFGPVQPQPGKWAAAFGIYHADKQTLFREEELPLGRALRGETCDNLEIFHRHPLQKEEQWLSANSRPVRDASGRSHGAVLVLQDITQRKQAEETQARLLAILEETSDFVGTARVDGSMFYANRALRGLRGVLQGAPLDGLKIEGIYPPRTGREKLQSARETALKLGAWRGENIFRYHTGEEIPVSQLIMSHRNPQGEVEFMSTIARDISEIKENETKLRLIQKDLEASLVKERELSRSDALTGLPNRRAFIEAAETEMARSRRYSHHFSVAYLDLDGFKKVNDTLGHNTGDEVLATVAKILRSNLRTSDTVARLGGDEFAILLPETHPTAAKEVLTKLQKLLRIAMKAGGWKVDFSIGLASFLEPPVSVDDLIRTADELMYSVKTNGKGALAAAVMG